MRASEGRLHLLFVVCHAAVSVRVLSSVLVGTYVCTFSLANAVIVALLRVRPQLPL